MDPYQQPHPQHPQAPMPVSAGVLLSAGFDRFGAVLRAALVPILITALLGLGGSGGISELELSAGTVILLVVLGSVFGSLYFALQVWCTRAAAASLGISPRSGNDSSTLATGFLVSLIVVLGLVLLIIPGIVAAVLLSMVASIVAYEGVGGWETCKASASIVRAHVGTFILVALVLFVAPSLLDPMSWGASGSFVTYAWQFALGVAMTTVAIGTYGEAWRRTRGLASMPPRDAPPGQPLQHPFTPPTGY